MRAQLEEILKNLSDPTQFVKGAFGAVADSASAFSVKTAGGVMFLQHSSESPEKKCSLPFPPSGRFSSGTSLTRAIAEVPFGRIYKDIFHGNCQAATFKMKWVVLISVPDHWTDHWTVSIYLEHMF